MLLNDIAYKVLKTKDYAKRLLWMPKFLLRSIFLWPNSKTYHQIVIACTVTLPLMIFVDIGLLKSINSFDTSEGAVLHILIIIAFCQSISKICFLLYFSTPIKVLLDDMMTKFWPYDLVEGPLKTNLKTFYYTGMAIMVPIFFMSIYLCSVFIIPPIFMEGRKLPFPLTYSFDIKASPTYEVLYILETIGFVVIVVFSILGHDFLFISFGLGAVGQYRILQHCLSRYNRPDMKEILKKLQIIQPNEKSRGNERQDYFVKCVRHHQLLIGFSRNINKVFSIVFLLQLGYCVAGISLAIFISRNGNTSIRQILISACITVGYLNLLFFYCIVGNQLYHEASLLPDYIFRCNWIELEASELRRDVTFLLQHSQRVLQLSAFNVYDLNMASFLTVVKLSFSLYTILSNMS